MLTSFLLALVCATACVLVQGTMMVHEDQQGLTANISAPESSCLIAQLPITMGEIVPDAPSLEFIGCHSTDKLNLTQYVDVPSAWKSLQDLEPTVNMTAACAAHCVSNNTYKQFQLALVGGVHCFCLSEEDRISTDREFYSQVPCQPWVSNSTLQARVYSASLQCPLNLDLCERVNGCELEAYPGGHSQTDGKQCCLYNTDNDPENQSSAVESYSISSGMLQYIIAIIFCLALIEALVYGWIRRRAYLRGEHLQTLERDAGEAAELSEALLGTFPTIEPPRGGETESNGQRSRAQPHDTTMVEVEMTPMREGVPPVLSLVRPGSMNHCIVTLSPLAVPPVASVPLEGIVAEDDDGDDVADCSVCLEPVYSKPAVKLPCRHTMHAECLKDYMSHELKKKDKIPCPMCRATIGSAKDVVRPALAVPRRQS